MSDYTEQEMKEVLEAIDGLKSEYKSIRESQQQILLALKGDRKMGHRGIVSRVDSFEEMILRHDMWIHKQMEKEEKLTRLESDVKSLNRRFWVGAGALMGFSAFITAFRDKFFGGG